MAIKAGQILHLGNGFVLKRLQSGGVSSLNIPKEQIRELGNFQSLEYLRDIADVTFALESLDVSTDIEAILTGVDPDDVVDGDEFDLGNAMPLDIVSPWKKRYGDYTIQAGVIVPNLYMSDATYRFGLRQNATQTFTLHGDGLAYLKGTPKYQVMTLVNNTLVYNFAQSANVTYNDNGDTLNAISACVKNPSTHDYKRLFFGADYTNTSTAITLLHDWFDEGFTELHVTYGTTVSNTFPQSVNVPVSPTAPSAVRGRDIEVFLSSATATTTLGRWSNVQSFEATRRVTLEADEEFGNSHYVSQDYDVPEVSGNIVVKPVDVLEMISKVQQVAGVGANEMAGTLTSVELELEARVYKPGTKTVLKTIYIPDARIDVPAIEGRVGQKATTTFNFQSDSGTLLSYAGERA